MVEEVHKFLSGNNITPDSFSQTLFNELLKLSVSQKPSLVVKLLQPLLSHYSVSEVDLNNKVKRFFDVRLYFYRVFSYAMAATALAFRLEFVHFVFVNSWLVF